MKHHVTAQDIKPRTEALEETRHAANTSILTLEPPELWENTFLLFELLSLWYFITADD